MDGFRYCSHKRDVIKINVTRKLCSGSLDKLVSLINFFSIIFKERNVFKIDRKDKIANNDVLQYALENGMIDLAYVREQIEMNKRKEVLERHPYKIWEGKDGKWYTYLPNKEKGRVLKKRSTEKEVEDIVIEYWKEQMENPTVEEVFSEWNNRRLKLGKISDATHLRYKQTFNRHFLEFGKRKIKSICQEDVEEFLEEQIPEYDLTSKAFSNLKTITRGFLKRAKKRKLIDFNVEELFQEMDVSDSDFHKVIHEDYEEVFDEDEMPKIMEYLIEHLDMSNIAIILMFVTGARIGEIVTLKHSDFNGNTFKIRRTETRYKKDGKYVCEVKDFPKTHAGVRTAIIPNEYEWLARKIQLLNPFEEYIFVKNGKRVTTHSIRMRLRRVCDKVGIYRKSPHKIRKTYGSILLDNHIDNQLIIGQMGHTNILCTETHYHRNRKGIEKKSSIISSIPEFQSKMITS